MSIVPEIRWRPRTGITLLAVSATADAGTTVWALSQPGTVEANPFAAAVQAGAGPMLGTIVFAVTVVIVAAVALTVADRIRHQACRRYVFAGVWAWVLMVTVGKIAIAVHNAHVALT